MKLKKIASLALAGIMAVSMLAGCKDGGNSNSGSSSGNTNTTSSYTDTVLAETRDTTKVILSTSSNDKLDRAIAFAAKNHVESNLNETLTWVNGAWEYQNLTETIMADAQYTDNNGDDNLASKVNALTEDGTVYTMYTVARTMDDEWITKKLANLVDHWASVLEADTDSMTYDYTIRIAKVDSLAGKEADRAEDTVLIGVAITVDQTEVKY